MLGSPDGFEDPRPSPTDKPDEAEVANALRPRVAKRTPVEGMRLLVGGAVVLGIVAFVWLSAHRTQRVRNLENVAAPISGTSAEIDAPPPPPELNAVEQQSGLGRGLAQPAPPLTFTAAPTPTPFAPVGPAVVVASPSSTSARSGEAAQRRKAPALVVDLADAADLPAASETSTPLTATVAPAASGVSVATGTKALAGGPVAPPALNSDEQFASRVESAEPERARATMLRNQPFIIPQGAMIPGVLETALNSDLPGYARAVVSRDVRSFDGANVLIPRGSRVIGQYKSAVALGQSRAFVIWTRVIRPDGGSIQIGSSGADQLGRAGMEGKVDRHFFQRFGGALLLSVVNTGSAIVVNRAIDQVGVGSPQQATGLASTIGPTDIPPTIKVAQGTPIRIFVARDLDFSGVQDVPSR